MTQHWGDVTFLHWPVDPSVVAPLLPPGTWPDVREGVTWVGLVPFVMSRVSLLGTPPLPHLSAFPETDVRPYARDQQGRRGVSSARWRPPGCCRCSRRARATACPAPGRG